MLNLFKKLAKKVNSNANAKTYYYKAITKSKQQKQCLQKFVSSVQCMVPDATGTQVSLITNNTRLIINTIEGTIAIQALTYDDVEDISFTETKVER